MARATEAELIAEMNRMGWANIKDAAVDAWDSFGRKWPADGHSSVLLMIRDKNILRYVKDSPVPCEPQLCCRVVLRREYGYQDGRRAVRVTATLDGTSLMAVLQIDLLE